MAFQAFCEDCWYIRHPAKGRVTFVMSEAQLETAESFIEHKHTVILKARQIGFSTLVAAYVFWYAFFYPDRSVVLLSRGEREAVELLAKAKYGYSQLPRWVKDRGPILTAKTRLMMPFTNNSTIESLPSGEDPARGKSVSLVVVDEMAFLKDPANAWASIEPITDVGGRSILLSTANGVGNIFHDIWQGSQTKSGVGSQYHGIFFPWSVAAGVQRDDAWYEAKKNELAPWVLAQEYPDNAEEAFIKSGRPVFDLDTIRSLLEIPPTYGRLERSGGRVEFVEEPSRVGQVNTGLRVWEHPDDAKGVYVIGADVAEGLDHGDYSAAYVIDARSREVVAGWHGHIDADLFGEVLVDLGLYYNNALIGCEVNNHGLTTIKAMQRLRYPNIWRQRKFRSKKDKRPTELFGWQTTSVTKPLAVDELGAALRDGTVHVYDGECHAELLTYVRDERGRTNGSPHDDRVMALAIAVQMLKFAFMNEFTVKPEPGVGTIGWLERLVYREEEERRRFIGAFSGRKR